MEVTTHFLGSCPPRKLVFPRHCWGIHAPKGPGPPGSPLAMGKVAMRTETNENQSRNRGDRAMFTNDNRRNRRFAAITTVAAAAFLVTTADFAAPKRDNVNSRHRQVDADFVKIIHPATPPSAPG